MSENLPVQNPFRAPGELATERQGAAAALVQTESARAIQEVQAAMAIAKRFPRDEVQATDRILAACTRPALAEAALYEYSRGGTAITGPSIRLAEAMAQAWGNIQFGIRELEQRPGESTVEAFAWDMETNVRQTKVFQVSHIRHTKEKRVQLLDPRDIYETVANQGARRLRACILGVIPGDVVEAATKQCEVTLEQKGAVTPERLKAMVDRFAEYGVTREMLEKRVQRRLDTITPSLMANLGKIYNSIRDDMSKPSDWFEMPAAGTQPAAPKKTAPPKGAAKLDEMVNQKRQAAAPPPQEAPPPPTEEEAPPPPEEETPPPPRPAAPRAKQYDYDKVPGAVNVDGSWYIECPNSGDQMLPGFCNGSCKMRQGCPSWDGV